MPNRIMITDGDMVKTLNPFTDETPGVWVGGSNTEVKAAARSVRLVPSVFAGVAARMQAMADLPFAIYSVKGDKEIDNSDNYKNAIQFLPYPSRTFSLSEGSLTVAGRAYWYKANGTNTGNVKELRYWMPTSVTLDPDAAKAGQIVFVRQGQSQKFLAEVVLYMWLLDPDIELGPPGVWPLASAMIAAEASGSINKWVGDYMKRGAIKAMLLMADGATLPGEVERVESWFNKFMTGARGLTWRVFNSAGLKPEIIGEGLEALKDLSINKELRYEIHQALGTRHLLEDENFATAEGRERQFYTITIVPDARLIQYAMNEQILHEKGYHLEFEPGRLEIFQENEKEQAESFGELFTTFREVMSVETAFELASQKLDYTFTDEQKALISKGIADKQAKAEADTEAAKPVEPPKEPPMKPETVRALVELDKWQAKVEKAGKMVTWHAIDLSPEMVKAIKDEELSFADARAQINPTQMLFAPAVREQERKDIKLLADAMNKMADAMAKPEVKVEQIPPTFTFTMPDIHLTTQMPEAGAVTVNVPDAPPPIINVSVEPTPVTVENNNQIDVPETTVNVAAPDVKIENTIESRKKRKVKIKYDKNDKAIGMEEE